MKSTRVKGQLFLFTVNHFSRFDAWICSGAAVVLCNWTWLFHTYTVGRISEFSMNVITITTPPLSHEPYPRPRDLCGPEYLKYLLEDNLARRRRSGPVLEAYSAWAVQYLRWRSYLAFCPPCCWLSEEMEAPPASIVKGDINRYTTHSPFDIACLPCGAITSAIDNLAKVPPGFWRLLGLVKNCSFCFTVWYLRRRDKAKESKRIL